MVLLTIDADRCLLDRIHKQGPSVMEDLSLDDGAARQTPCRENAIMAAAGWGVGWGSTWAKLEQETKNPPYP